MLGIVPMQTKLITDLHIRIANFGWALQILSSEHCRKEDKSESSVIQGKKQQINLKVNIKVNSTKEKINYFFNN